jgi:hypothetical protein
LLLVLAISGWTAACLLAGVLIAGARTPHSASVPPSPATAVARPADQQDSVSVSLVGVRTGEQLMTQLAASFGRPVHPHWEHMPIRPDSTVRFDIPAADATTVFRLLNSQVNDAFGGILDYRLYPDHAEIATQEYFDRQEITAVNYDVAALVRAVQTAAPAASAPTENQIVQSVITSIEQNVAPDHWMDNGGDLARVNLVGSGLLISAPQRFHPQIAWVLEQIEKTPGWTTGLQRLLSPVTSAAGAAAAPAAGAGSGGAGGGVGGGSGSGPGGSPAAPTGRPGPGPTP